MQSNVTTRRRLGAKLPLSVCPCARVSVYLSLCLRHFPFSSLLGSAGEHCSSSAPFPTRGHLLPFFAWPRVVCYLVRCHRLLFVCGGPCDRLCLTRSLPRVVLFLTCPCHCSRQSGLRRPFMFQGRSRTEITIPARDEAEDEP